MRLLRILVLGFLMGLPQENHRTAKFANGAEVLQLSTVHLSTALKRPKQVRDLQLGKGQARCSPWYHSLTAPNHGVSTGQRVSPGLVKPK